MTDFQQPSFFGVNNNGEWLPQTSMNWDLPAPIHQLKSSQTSPNTTPPQQQFSPTQAFDPSRVPQTIKGAQFINISGVIDQDPWIQQSTSAPGSSIAFLANKKQLNLVPKLISKSEDTILPPAPLLTHQYTQQQIQEQQDEQQNDIEEEINGQSRYKTELCRSFQETGNCRYGYKCQFAHGTGEVRPVVRHPKYKTETCKTFHNTGNCPYGPRCRFIHGSIDSSKLLQPQQFQQQPLQQQSSNNSTPSNSPTYNPMSMSSNSVFDNTQMMLMQPLASPSMIHQHKHPLVKSASEKSIPTQQPFGGHHFGSNSSSDINWSTSWSNDSGSAATSFSQPSSLPTSPSKEDKDIVGDKRRLAIFKSISPN